LCTGLFMGAYAPMCLVTGFVLPHLNPKRAVQCGVSIMALCAVGMVVIVAAAQRGYMAGHAAVILALMTAPYGMAMAFFWPYIVGWLSAGHEGAALNRRVQWFSASFSMANLLSPLAGGVLVQHSSIAPLLAPLVLLVSGVAVISLAPRPKTTGADNKGAIDPSAREELNERLLSFRWSARVLMVVQYLCYGLLRCQMPLLLTFNLGLSESLFGIVMAVLCGVNFLTYVTMGRTDRWHYRRWFLWASQVLMVLTLVLILTSKSFVWLLVAGGLCGIAQSIIYGSHLYYSLTGNRNRSGVMGLHEFILASCFFGGSFLAGRVSDHWGRYAPYQGGLILIGLGVLAQVVLWVIMKRKSQAAALPTN
jgi:MFS family permease